MLASVSTCSTNLYDKPDALSSLETQLLFGEVFEIEKETDGWAFGICQTDGYQGWVRSENLTKDFSHATHIITARSTCFYESPNAKAKPLSFLPHLPHLPHLSMGARIYVEDEGQGGEGGGGGFVQTKQGFIPQKHLTQLESLGGDFVESALCLLGTPYLWGGRDSTQGIDCSALLQLGLMLAGHRDAGHEARVPRNSNDQEAQLGKALDRRERLPQLQRGDLVFWQAHIGIMVDDTNLLHANAFHMATAIEPFAQAEKRIQKVVGSVRAIKRL